MSENDEERKRTLLDSSHGLCSRYAQVGHQLQTRRDDVDRVRFLLQGFQLTRHDDRHCSLSVRSSPGRFSGICCRRCARHVCSFCGRHRVGHR